MLGKIARFCVSRRLIVIGIWLLLAIGAVLLSSSLGSRYANEFRLPKSESQEVFEILKSEFPDFKGQSVQVVFKADAGVLDPASRAEIEALFSRLSELPHVAAVRSPYQGGGGISSDQKVGFGSVELDEEAVKIPREDIAAIRDTIIGASRPGLQVEAGGMAVSLADMPEFGRSEIIGLLVAILVLLIGFGSIMATGLPIMTALFTLVTAMSLIVGLSHLTDVPVFAPDLARMIGLGVGIDYALLVVTRFRQNLHAGLDPKEATVLAIQTAGRSVLFAGMIVAISLLGLFAMGLEFVYGMALSAGLSVVLAIATSLTLLPVALVTLGRKIDSLRIPIFSRDESDYHNSWSHKWSRAVQRRPWWAAIVSSAILVVLAVPTFSIDLGASDLGHVPNSKTQRRAYDLLSEAFGPGFNGPLIVLVRAGEKAQQGDAQDRVAQPEGGDGAPEHRGAPPSAAPQAPPVPAGVADIIQRLSQTEGVAQVGPPIPAPSGEIFMLQVIPGSAPQDRQSRDLVHAIRSDLAPAADNGNKVMVGGLTALFVDLSDYLSQRLFFLIGGVVALSFLLLMVVFRSLLVPLKAAIMNVLSIGAAYGVVVAIFQWGWLKGAVGLEKAGPVEPYIPMMMFAILFGLSMDYEVFLISRIREEYDKTGDAKGSVADGLAATARVITAAAAIMVAVFLSFVWNDERIIKLFGLGLATAIFVDATLVRLILVPSTMELLGRANWWLPGWLDKLLPKLTVEVDETKARISPGLEEGTEDKAEDAENPPRRKARVG